MKKPWAYYNDSDPFVCEWARNLIKAGLVPDGYVDCRPIQEVMPDDLEGFVQCHFFCGILGWPLALRLAGWPDDVPIWTGSCPCQPFSDAGKKRGTDDPRHLWPDFFRLIAAREPEVATGEQVASKDGREWLDGVRADLEGMEYEVGYADLCAAGVGAPHIRQRLFWLAESGRAERRWRAQPGWQHGGALHAADSRRTLWMADAELRREGGRKPGVEGQEGGGRNRSAVNSHADGMADTEHDGGRSDEPQRRPQGRAADWWAGSGFDRMVNSEQQGLEGHGGHGDNGDQSGRLDTDQDGPVAASGAWTPFRAVTCRDNRARRIPLIESGVLPLAYGIPRNVGSLLPGVAAVGPDAKVARRNRVGRLKGYGNAIVPQVAAEFIRAYMECG